MPGRIQMFDIDLSLGHMALFETTVSGAAKIVRLMNFRPCTAQAAAPAALSNSAIEFARDKRPKSMAGAFQ
ncbi:MAG: hypothetical protein ACJ8KC_00015 [Candidatus Udaeobacter sp.]